MKIDDGTGNEVDLNEFEVKKVRDSWEKVKEKIPLDNDVDEVKCRRSFFHIIGYDSMFLNGGDNIEERVKKFVDNEEWKNRKEFWKLEVDE